VNSGNPGAYRKYSGQVNYKKELMVDSRLYCSIEAFLDKKSVYTIQLDNEDRQANSDSATAKRPNEKIQREIKAEIDFKERGVEGKTWTTAQQTQNATNVLDAAREAEIVEAALAWFTREVPKAVGLGFETFAGAG
jgi:hypothetical protein